jgi:hypothetical protein
MLVAAQRFGCWSEGRRQDKHPSLRQLSFNTLSKGRAPLATSTTQRRTQRAASGAPVQVHELDGDLLEGALREQVALDARQRLVRVVVRLRAGARKSPGLQPHTPRLARAEWQVHELRGRKAVKLHSS